MREIHLVELGLLIGLTAYYYYWLERHKGKNNPKFMNFAFLAAICAVVDYLTSVLLLINIEKSWSIIQRFTYCIGFYPFFLVCDYIAKETKSRENMVGAPVKKDIGYRLISFFLSVPALVALVIAVGFLVPQNYWEGIELVKSGLIMAWLLGLVRVKISEKYFINLSN